MDDERIVVCHATVQLSASIGKDVRRVESVDPIYFVNIH